MWAERLENDEDEGEDNTADDDDSSCSDHDCRSVCLSVCLSFDFIATIIACLRVKCQCQKWTYIVQNL